MAGRRYVITGGPSAGKTTLIELLEQAGHRTVEEPGRAIIVGERAIGGSALPWADREAYARAQWERHLGDFQAAAQGEGTVFFDRGLPDVIGYLQLSGLAVPPEMIVDAKRLRYNEPVFVAPWWSDIYTRDSERRQSPEEAEQTCAVMRRTYVKLGYETIDLPLGTPEERLEFVMRQAGSHSGI